jgi:hypothetical protein
MPEPGETVSTRGSRQEPDKRIRRHIPQLEELRGGREEVQTQMQYEPLRIYGVGYGAKVT